MTEPQDEEPLPEYDFRGGVRGKYVKRHAEGCNVVVLEPDVAEAFPNADAVNEALREVLRRRPTDDGERPGA